MGFYLGKSKKKLLVNKEQWICFLVDNLVKILHYKLHFKYFCGRENITKTHELRQLRLPT